jgi:hypothetical protein
MADRHHTIPPVTIVDASSPPVNANPQTTGGSFDRDWKKHKSGKTASPRGLPTARSREPGSTCNNMRSSPTPMIPPLGKPPRLGAASYRASDLVHWHMSIFAAVHKFR